MKSLHTRSVLALVAVVLVATVSMVVSRGYSFVVTPPIAKLSEFPMEIDGWVGTLEEVKDGVADILDASDMTSVRYMRGIDGPLFVHAATWTNPDSVAETCPHHPNICYRGNGWVPVVRKRVDLKIDSVGLVPIEMTVMQRGDQKVVVAFCYRMGDRFFADETEARLVQLGFWGQKSWPSVTKFMIQTPHSTIEPAQPLIEKFVREFFAWHRI
jgi:EpsI family protein